MRFETKDFFAIAITALFPDVVCGMRQTVISIIFVFLSHYLSNVLEKFEAQKYKIQTYKNLLTKLVNEKNDIKQTISKLKEDIISQEIGKRELLDNITLHKIREKLEILKEQYKKFNSMDYKKKLIQLKNENRKRYSLDDNSGPPKKKYYFTE